ncbi:MAG: hypothetical protein ABSF50_15615 [Burkholderiaceae bacterium]|jgi:hypothetical protein
MRKAIRFVLAILATLAAGAATACALPSYNLPIPFQLYALGATAALAVSFVLVGYLVSTPSVVATANLKAFNIGRESRRSASLIHFFTVGLQLLGVCGLALTIATGIFGSPIPIANFNITFFFVIFVLGVAYASALMGDIYQFLNPWLAICEWCDEHFPRAFRGRYSYPRALAYYPALIFYMAYIWIELFANISPFELSMVLVAYSVINIAGAWAFGKTVWFERCEFLAVLFRFIAKMAPIHYVRTGAQPGALRIELRKPFIGLILEPATEISALVFVLFMLSSTALDGAHETLPWVGLFWKGIYPFLAGIGAGLEQPILFSVDAYYGWQWLMLFLSPLAYLLVYIAFILAAKVVSGSKRSLRSLILQFAYTLVPIAFVYNVTHYFTLFLAQGYQIGRMVSDPFNRGWNLFGTATWGTDPFIPDANTVWHVQVGLILVGHIVSVYLAHVEALRIFPSSRKAAVSQLPMLVLMMVFTTLGLWILSLPISAGQITDTAAMSTQAPSQ